ncbi:MAG TPA: hypothetical protein PKI46_03875, partial [Bacteroidales bacterium]|nr:hypothetical protein [Bacteroidales bacterium]
NDNQFEVIYKYDNTKILILCSNIRCRNADIPFYVCNSQIKSDIRSGVIKICQVLDGMYDIKILEYKKYEMIYENVKREVSNRKF